MPRWFDVEFKKKSVSCPADLMLNFENSFCSFVVLNHLTHLCTQATLSQTAKTWVSCVRPAVTTECSVYIQAMMEPSNSSPTDPAQFSMQKKAECSRMQDHFSVFLSQLVQTRHCLSHLCVHSMHWDHCTCLRSHAHSREEEEECTFVMRS